MLKIVLISCAVVVAFCYPKPQDAEIIPIEDRAPDNIPSHGPRVIVVSGGDFRSLFRNMFDQNNFRFPSRPFGADGGFFGPGFNLPLLPQIPSFPQLPSFPSLGFPTFRNISSQFPSFPDLRFPSFGINSEDYPDNYHNTTYEERDLNGTLVSVNKTIHKSSSPDGSRKFHFQVVHVNAQDDTNQNDYAGTVDDEMLTETNETSGIDAGFGIPEADTTLNEITPSDS